MVILDGSMDGHSILSAGIVMNPKAIFPACIWTQKDTGKLPRVISLFPVSARSQRVRSAACTIDQPMQHWNIVISTFYGHHGLQCGLSDFSGHIIIVMAS